MTIRIMNTKDLEKEIIKTIREDSKLPLATDVGHKVLIKLVKKLFNEYKEELKYTNATVLGLLKVNKWVNYVKVLVAICTIRQTGSEDQKETKEI